MKKLVKFKTNKGMTHLIFSQGHPEYSRGMTYIELIVVLSIFSVMSSVVLFNYGEFQAKVDLKNLASDIALKVVEAQNASLSGKLPVQSFGANWKPSYGIYLNITTPTQFIYFVDLNNLNGYESGEMLDTISITKANFIDKIEKCTGDTCASSEPISPLSIAFKRPDSSAIFKDSNGITLNNNFDYIKITIKSPKGVTAFVRIYLSGRIQVN